MAVHAKTEINLLPPARHRRRVVYSYISHIGHVLRVLLLLTLMVLMVLVTTWLVNWSISRSYTAALAEGNGPEQGAVELVRAVNRTALKAAAWRIQHAAATEQLPDVMAALPADLHLTSLSYAEVDGTVTIKGVFTSRESLLAYQRALEELSWVERLEAPLKNFATGANSSFTFTLFRKTGL